MSRTFHSKSVPHAGQTLSDAFTLLELLLVIAVMAILTALILPALGAAKGKARTIQCASNLRQVTLAASMYADDCDGHLPPRSIIQNWVSHLAPYYQDSNLLSCPTEKRSGQRSYAINSFSDWFEANLNSVQFMAFRIWEWPKGFPLNSVEDPSDTILFGEKKLDSAEVHIDLFQDGGNHLNEVDQRRHNDASNFGFVDGTVRRLRDLESVRPINQWAVTARLRHAE